MSIPGAKLAAPSKKGARPLPKRAKPQEDKQKDGDGGDKQQEKDAVKKKVEEKEEEEEEDMQITWKSNRLYHPLASGVTRVPIVDSLLLMPPTLTKQNLPHNAAAKAEEKTEGPSAAHASSPAGAKVRPKRSGKKKLVGDDDDIEGDVEGASPAEVEAAAAKKKKNKQLQSEQLQLEYLNRIDPAKALQKCLPDLSGVKITLARDFFMMPTIVGNNSERSNLALQMGTPRGLHNGANACFVASVLQILLQVPAFATVCVSAAMAFSRKKAEFKFVQARKEEMAAAENKGNKRKKPEVVEEKKQQQQQQQQNDKKQQKQKEEKEDSTPAAAAAAAAEKESARLATEGTSATPLAPPALDKEPHEHTASLLGRWTLSYWTNSGSAFALPALSVLPQHVQEQLAALSEKERKRSLDNMAGAVQQDAHEFLQLLMDRVDEDCKSLGLTFRRDSLFESGAGSPVAAAAARASQPNTPLLPPAPKSGNASNQQPQQQQQQPSSEPVRTATGSVYDAHSPCSLIFGGELQVQVREKGFADASIAAPSPVSKLVEPFSIFTCSVANGGSSVMQCVEKALAKEVIEAAKKDSNDQMRHQKVQLAPQYALIVQLARWAMKEKKPGQFDIVKLENTIKIDQRLTIPITTGGSAKYRLRAVLCHRGRTPASGHYVTYVFQTQAEFTAQQYREANTKSNGVNPNLPQKQQGAGGGATTAADKKPKQPLVWQCNDAKVSLVPDPSVIEKDTPYLLCYIRE